jgi:glycosyltransferase involved in cell wall biosynthesis
MKVAYLISIYPKVSHTFIRREIEALENAGIAVLRYAIRRASDRLIDERDRAELGRTRVLLDAGPIGLGFSALRALVMRPRRFVRALARAIRLARESPRGTAVNLVYLAEASALLWELRRSGAQHLHAHFSTNPASVALLCRDLGGPPFSFTIHSPDTNEIPFQTALSDKAAAASFVATISDRVREQVLPWLGEGERHKVHVVRTVFTVEDGTPTDAEVPDRAGFVCVARLSPEKGHLVLLQALERVVQAGVDARLELVGDGPLRADIERSVAGLGLGDRVRLRGNLDEAAVRACVLGARALVLASFQEGLPVVLLEAFAWGRPVIATAVGSVHELVENGRSGWIVPSGAPEALAAAMCAAAHAPRELLIEMARVGRQRVAACHAPREQASILARLFSNRETEG